MPEEGAGDKAGAVSHLPADFLQGGLPQTHPHLLDPREELIAQHCPQEAQGQQINGVVAEG